MMLLVLLLLAPPEYRTWESYGGGPEQIRYSSLGQIHRGNVKDLEVAWTHDTGETGGLQTQPIIVDGVLYAFDTESGDVRWRYRSEFPDRIVIQGFSTPAEEPGRVVPRQELLARVWDPVWHGSGKTLDVHVSSLRRKLPDPTAIETVRGVGYRLSDQAVAGL